MNICNDNHEDIAFEGRNCPLCELRSSSEEIFQELTALNKSLSEDIDNLNDKYIALLDTVKSHVPELLI